MSKVELFSNKDKPHSIKQVADILGVHPQTLRNWESLDLIHPERISGDQRIYTRSELEKIEKIWSLKERGWNIQAIRDYLLEMNGSNNVSE